MVNATGEQEGVGGTPDITFALQIWITCLISQRKAAGQNGRLGYRTM